MRLFSSAKIVDNADLTRILLFCGILSSLHYTLINIFVPFFWKEYSVLNHTVSELSAIGAPTRSLWVSVAMPYVFLFAAFGWGILRVAAGNRELRALGYVILLYSAFNFYWPPMHLREVLAAGGGTISDTLHLTWAGVTVFLFLAIMGLGAAAMGTRFRIYTVISMALLFLFGMLTSMGAPNVEKNLPTPMIGVWERINTGIFLLWVVALSLILLTTTTLRRGIHEHRQ